DFHVTGVQTCALPIWVTRMTLAKLNSPNVKQGRIKCCHVPKPPAGSQRRLTAKSKINKRPDQKTGMEMPNKETTVARWARHELQIGRASCREREEIAV